jgi:hypothetical protein
MTIKVYKSLRAEFTCAICGYIMALFYEYETGQRLTIVYCTNNDCEQYNKKARVIPEALELTEEKQNV